MGRGARGKGHWRNERFEYRFADSNFHSDRWCCRPSFKRKAEAIPRLLTVERRKGDCRRGHSKWTQDLDSRIARAAGYGTWKFGQPSKPDDPTLEFSGRTLLHAARHTLIRTSGVESGEVAQYPNLRGYAGPQGIAVSRYGTIEGPITRSHALVSRLPTPSQNARRLLWSSACAWYGVEPPTWARSSG